jgi:glycine oxidase
LGGAVTHDGSPVHTADAIIVGGGLVGLSCAAELAATGATIILLSDRRAGEASLAAAGMLAPSVERTPGDAQHFAIAARDRYPSFLARIEHATGVRVPLSLSGILELASDETEAARLRHDLPVGSSWVTPAELRTLEPTLRTTAGAVLHARDGSVNNPLLLDALRLMLDGSSGVRVVLARATAISLARSETVRVHSAQGENYEAPHVVLAPGSWVGELRGLPRALPVEPVRGQMVALRGTAPRHVSYGAHGYLVPRGANLTLSGSTMERVGFRHGTTTEAVDALLQSAAAISTALDRAPVQSQWSGFRPMTPDGLPIIDREPEHPSVIYACGHSRNGILLAPLTGECVAAMITGAPLPQSLAPFAVTRFMEP